MQIEPEAAKFAETYERGAPQVVSTTLVGDLETAVSAYLKVAINRAPAFLLEFSRGRRRAGAVLHHRP